jgi:hypothetical protein
MKRIDSWIKQRRGGSFIFGSFVFISVGAICTCVALFVADSSGSKNLEVAGNFATGVASLFGLAAVSAALLANYVVANRESRDAEDAWSKKLRLEEALAFYPFLVRHGANIQSKFDPDYTNVGLNPLVRHAIIGLRDALQVVRRTGLARVLSIISKNKQIDDLGLALMILEAWVVDDIDRPNLDLGQNVANQIAFTPLLEELQKIGYDEIAKYWNCKWSKLDEAKVLAARFATKIDL